MPETLIFRSEMPVSAEELYAWHERPSAFEDLIPPWQSVELVHRDDGLYDGARLEMRLWLGPISITWVALHENIQPGREFTDIQERGPFHSWKHTHRMIPIDDKSCYLEDEIHFETYWFLRRKMKADLQKMFDYRHEVTRKSLMDMHALS